MSMLQKHPDLPIPEQELKKWHDLAIPYFTTHVRCGMIFFTTNVTDVGILPVSHCYCVV